MRRGIGLALALALALMLALPAGAAEAGPGYKEEVLWTEWTSVEPIDVSMDYGPTGYYKVRDGAGRCGIVDGKNQVRLPCEYGEIGPASTYADYFTFPVEQGGRWGLWSTERGMLVPLSYAGLKLGSGGCRVKKNGAWGMLGSDLEPLVPCAYEDIEALSWGYRTAVAAKKDGKWGFFYADGSGELAPFVYDGYDGSFRDLILTFQGGKAGCISHIYGGEAVTVPCTYDRLSYRIDGYGYAAVQRDGRWGAVSLKDGAVSPLVWEEEPLFGANFAVVGGTFWKQSEADPAQWEQVYQTFEDARPFEERGAAAVKLGGKWGAMELSGDLFLPCIYDDIGSTADLWPDYDLLTKVRRDGLVGYVNGKGEEVVPPTYDQGSDKVGYGYAIVEKDGKTGAIGADGTLVLPLEQQTLDTLGPFEGYWVAIRNGKYGLLDAETGAVAAPFRYDSMTGMARSACVVSVDGRWGFLRDPKSAYRESVLSIQWLPQYERVDGIAPGTGRVVVAGGGLFGLAALDGTAVLPYRYPNLYYEMESGRFLAQEGDAWGVPDRKEGLWGQIDRDGNVLTPFDSWSPTVMRLGVDSLQREDGLYVLAGSDQKPLSEHAYAWIGAFQPSGLAIVSRDDQKGVLDLKGREVIPCEYGDVRWAGEGMIALFDDWKVGFADETGQVVVPLQYANGDYLIGGMPHGGTLTIQSGNHFYRGVCAVYLPGEKEGELELAFIDKAGNRVETPDYEVFRNLEVETSYGEEHPLEPQGDGTVLFTDGRGNRLVVPGYDPALDREETPEEEEHVLLPDDFYGNDSGPLTFTDGYAVVMRDQVYGLVKDPRRAGEVSDWARAEVEAARNAGLVTARTDSYLTYEVTRLQFAELAVNLVEKALGRPVEPVEADRFTDTGDLMARKAAAAGIVTGTGDGSTFSPDAFITREQIAAMLYRAEVYLLRERDGLGFTPLPLDRGAYADVDQISSWAEWAMGHVVGRGILKGTSADTLSPKDNTTVEQAILMVLRASGDGGAEKTSSVTWLDLPKEPERAQTCKVVHEGENYALVDQAGKVLVSPGAYDYIGQPVGGLLAVRKTEQVEPYGDPSYGLRDTRERWGFLNTFGEVAAPLEYDRVWETDAALVPVQKGSGVHGIGFLDRTGREVVPCAFVTADLTLHGGGYVGTPSPDFLGVVVNEDGTAVLVENWQSGYAPIRGEQGLWGYADQAGNLVTEQVYESVSSPSAEGLVLVRQDGTYGLLNLP